MNETLNIQELSSYLRCSVSEIRKLVKSKKIPFYRVGSKLFFKKDSINRWITQQEVNNLLDYDFEAKIMPLNKEVN